MLQCLFSSTAETCCHYDFPPPKLKQAASPIARQVSSVSFDLLVSPPIILVGAQPASGSSQRTSPEELLVPSIPQRTSPPLPPTVSLPTADPLVPGESQLSFGFVWFTTPLNVTSVKKMVSRGPISSVFGLLFSGLLSFRTQKYAECKTQYVGLISTSGLTFKLLLPLISRSLWGLIWSKIFPTSLRSTVCLAHLLAPIPSPARSRTWLCLHHLVLV